MGWGVLQYSQIHTETECPQLPNCTASCAAIASKAIVAAAQKPLEEIAMRR